MAIMGKNLTTDEKKDALSRISESENVSVACQKEGIGRATYYRWKLAIAKNATDGLKPKSRKPKNSPHQTSNLIEQKVLVLARSGDYLFATKVERELKRQGISISTPTIIKILKRNGFWNRMVLTKHGKNTFTHIYKYK